MFDVAASDPIKIPHGSLHRLDLAPGHAAFLLTVSMSLLLGLGLREYYLINQKRIVFGSTRTCMLIGLIGFVLFHTRPDSLLYLCGLLVLGFWLGLAQAIGPDLAASLIRGGFWNRVGLVSCCGLTRKPRCRKTPALRC